METLLGSRHRDFVLLAADQTLAHSIILMKQNQNKFYKLSDRLTMAVSGDPGDAAQFSEYMSKNITLYQIRNSYELSPAAASNFIRRNLADSLRSRQPYHVSLVPC